MNSADTETLQQALALQGVVIGQHDQALKQIRDRLKDLSANLSSLCEQLTSQASLAAPCPAPSSPPSYHEPFVPAPEHYDDDLGSCRAFLVQCSLVFEQQPHMYASDCSRICYLIGLLTEAARAWGAVVWEKSSAVCFSYGAFTQEMCKVFDHPVRGKDAAQRLLSLRQGSCSVAEFAVEFRTLADWPDSESGWNDVALQGVFQNSLNDNIKDELVSRKEPDNLDELVSLTIQVDNQLCERRRERSSKP